MRTIKNIFSVASIFILMVFPSVLGATSIVEGTVESKKASEKYSLRNIGTLTHKTATFYTLKSSLVFKGMSKTTGSTNATYLKYNKGNITYVIPYRHKLNLSKFKTPTLVQP